MRKIYSLLLLTVLSFYSSAQCTGPTAVCQNINLYLDGSGNATIVGSDLNGGSTDDCLTGSLTYTASQTAFTCANLPVSAPGMVITGAYDGPLALGNPKGVELYVTGAIADLSTWGIGSANNGGGTDGIEFTFPAVSVPAGTFIYVSADSAGFHNYFGFAPDFVTGSMGINGDDAIELFQDSVVVDVFGDINVDGTGTVWDYLDGWAYRNDFVAANNGVWNATTFYYSGINAMDNELTNATAINGFPIGTFTTSGSAIPVTLTVTDGLMNMDQCVALITLLDTISPLPDNATLADQTASCEITSITAPTATDNCAGSITGTTSTTFPITASTTITWSYDDGNGNTFTQDQVVTINGLDLTTTLATPTITSNATGVTYQWIDCATNTPISGETNQNYTATVSGDYAVIIDNGSCLDTSACVNVFVAVCPGPTAVCQNINVYLDATGNITIADADLDGGSTDDCATGSLTVSASQTAFSCADLNAGGGGSGLIITGAYDGPLPGGVPKGIELYAGSAIADLSIYGVGSANNGGGTDGIEFTFPPVSVAAGTFLYVTTDSTGFNNFFGFDADFISGSMAINGDDAVELFQDSLVIDVFGDINVDGSGTAWDYLDGWAYRNDFSAANNGVWDETTFYYSGIDAMDFELTNATAATPFPVGSYVEAGSGIAVTLTVTDGLGNTDMCTAIVTVLDTLAPIPNLPVLADITSDCPVDSILVVASENCQGQIAGTTTTAFPITASTTITWTYTDASGNTSTQDQVVTINGLDVTITLVGYTATANATGVSYQWIDCADSSAITGETNQDYSPTTPGTYAVVIDNGVCSDTSECTLIDVEGIDELIDLGMTIAPNPSTGIFNVSFDDMVAGTVTIVDANGRLIQTQELNSNSMTVDLTAAQSGLYFMHVATEKGISRERIVKY